MERASQAKAAARTGEVDASSLARSGNCMKFCRRWLGYVHNDKPRGWGSKQGPEYPSSARHCEVYMLSHRDWKGLEDLMGENPPCAKKAHQ